jgi:translation initiation factor IF-3
LCDAPKGASAKSRSCRLAETRAWLKEGNQVRINLFLQGRSKFLDEKFLKDRMERLIKLVSIEHKIADPIKRGPKGLTVLLEKK